MVGSYFTGVSMDADHPYQIASTTNVAGPVGYLIGWAERPLKPAGTFRHSYIVLPDRIIEAAPGGVRINKLETWTGTGRTVYSDFDMSTDQKKLLDDVAHGELRKPYDYPGDVIVGLDGLWLDAWKRTDGDLFRLAELIEDRAHRAWFCSALTDYAMTSVGKRVFDDGRPFHAVNPQELAMRLLELFPDQGDA